MFHYLLKWQNLLFSQEFLFGFNKHLIATSISNTKIYMKKCLITYLKYLD